MKKQKLQEIFDYFEAIDFHPTIKGDTVVLAYPLLSGRYTTDTYQILKEMVRPYYVEIKGRTIILFD